MEKPERKLKNISADDSPAGYCYTSFKHDGFDKIELDEKDTDVYVTEEKSEEKLVDCLSFAGQQLKVLHVSYSLLLCIRLEITTCYVCLIDSTFCNLIYDFFCVPARGTEC